MQPPGTYPEPSRAIAILVMGILSVVICGLLGPVAWSMGNTELAAIDADRRPPQNRGAASAGRILGMIATFLLVIGTIVAVMVFAGLIGNGQFV